MFKDITFAYFPKPYDLHEPTNKNEFRSARVFINLQAWDENSDRHFVKLQCRNFVVTGAASL